MTTKNAILLIVKQNAGIDYNSLLTKFSSSYSNANSARAALSRSLKDLTTFGLLVKKENKYFLMEKGEGEIYSEIKNKLVLALNSLMNTKRTVDEIDSVVEKLQILIERSRQDRDLLKTSKSSLDFSISELQTVAGDLEKKTKHLEYISKVFSEQINSLKDMGFNDSFSREFSRDSLSKLASIFSSQPENEFMFESQNVVFLESLAEHASSKPKNNSLLVQKDSLKAVLEFVESGKPEFSIQPLNIFSSVLKAELLREKITLSGPYSEVSKWKE